LAQERQNNAERRVHVRVRPSADYDVSATFSEDGIVWLRLQVLDLSVGGLAVLIADDLAHKRRGDRLKLQLSLPLGVSNVSGTIRHLGRGVCGIEFDPLADADMNLVRTAVAELLERGFLA
jgi:hypothetical protein